MSRQASILNIDSSAAVASVLGALGGGVSRGLLSIRKRNGVRL